jgi:hypothetical protein
VREDRIRVMAQRWIPASWREAARRWQRRRRWQWPRMNTVDFGDLRRVRPISRAFALDRGLPVDRHYIEHFLAAHAADIRGRVLEIGDDRSAIGHLYRTLKPGGVLLATANGLSRIGRREGVDDWGEYWRFTRQSMERLFNGVFPPGQVSIEVYGNVLTAVGFLHGLAAEEFAKDELEYRDPDYEVLIGVRAVK